MEIISISLFPRFLRVANSEERGSYPSYHYGFRDLYAAEAGAFFLP